MDTLLNGGITANESASCSKTMETRFKWFGASAAVLSLLVSLILLGKHQVLGGPGDELDYHQQAANLIPFKSNYYGPFYYIALKLVHSLPGVDWFLSGKLLSWISACGVLLLTSLIARKALGNQQGMLVLALVAINPIFIDTSYSSYNVMFGTLIALSAIWAVMLVEERGSRYWLLSGVIFGVAALTRFQSIGFLAGAVVGTFIIPGASVKVKALRMICLLCGTLIPVVAWYGFLGIVQGGAPENYNFVHLTLALGEFKQFYEVDGLIRKYGSTWGVLSSHWTAPFRIAGFAAKRLVQFPFDVGFRLLFISAGWLLPGLLQLSRRRNLHGPWLGAFSIGLLLTGIGSQKWLFYYVAFIPFCAIIVALALDTSDRGPRAAQLGKLGWGAVIVATLLWSPLFVRDLFIRREWTELAQVRQYMKMHNAPGTLVASTIGSFPYGIDVPFIQQTAVVAPNEANQLVEKLRERGVTHLIVSERHTLWEFPGLEPLLDESTRVPSGLHRELLITHPKRIAILRVVAPDSGLTELSPR